jgi:hypothetical protein
LSEYKLAACAWPSQAAILQTTSVVYKLEIALLATSVESSAISLLASREPTSCRRIAGILPAQHAKACSPVWYFKQAITIPRRFADLIDLLMAKHLTK